MADYRTETNYVTGDVWVCNYDPTLKVAASADSAQKASFVNSCNIARQQGQTGFQTGLYPQNMQAPENKWYTLADEKRYALPKTPTQSLQENGTAIKANSLVEGTLVYVRFYGGLRRMIKMKTGLPYNYISAGSVIPYFVQVNKNAGKYTAAVVSWAKSNADTATGKAIIEAYEEGEHKSSFTAIMIPATLPEVLTRLSVHSYLMLS